MLREPIARMPGDPLRWAARAEFSIDLGGPERAHAALDCAERAVQGYRCRARLLTILAAAQANAGRLNKTAATMESVPEFMDGDAQRLPLTEARARLDSYRNG